MAFRHLEYRSQVDTVRYVLALIVVTIMPAGLSMWFLIHPWAPFWRRRGPRITYAVVIGMALLIAGMLFWFRSTLLRVEFGFSWVLTGLAVLVYAVAIRLEILYRRHLTVSTLLGLPEVSGNRPHKLLTDGIYAKIRHPRYVGLICEITGMALIANYLASYIVVAAAVPVLYLTVLLEERELLQRFGAEYETYMREVPRFIPKGRARSQSS